MLFSDDSTYQNLGFKHIPEEEAAADKKAIELLKNSPYAQKLDNVGLFLKALQARAPQLNALLDHAPGQSAGGKRNDQPLVRSGHARSGARQQQTRSDRGSASGRTREDQSLGRQGGDGEDGSGRHHLGARQDAVRSHAVLSAVGPLGCIERANGRSEHRSPTQVRATNHLYSKLQ